MNKKINKYLYWTPRILGIVFAVFLMVFSLDVFDSGLTGWQVVLGLFIHNLPSLFLLAIVVISWKHEIVGGVAFILAGLLYILLLVTRSNFEWYMLSWSVIIAGPAFLVGILFFVNWRRKTHKDTTTKRMS